MDCLTETTISDSFECGLKNKVDLSNIVYLVKINVDDPWYGKTLELDESRAGEDEHVG